MLDVRRLWIVAVPAAVGFRRSFVAGCGARSCGRCVGAVLRAVVLFRAVMLSLIVRRFVL